MRIQVAFFIVAIFLISTLITADTTWAQETRHFEFTYSCDVADVPANASRIDLWMPVPSDGEGQTIQRVKVNRPTGSQIGLEGKYGNRIFHKQFTGPFRETDRFSAQLVFDVLRQELVIPQAQSHARLKSTEIPEAVRPYLLSNQLVPLDDARISEIASRLRLSESHPLRAARSVYDYLIDEMNYNSSAQGAGRGDVRWACVSKTGDCADYHSMFLALCRSREIPADHEFGFSLPSDRRAGSLLRYHCWARFWAGDIGWIPVDVSDSDKHPQLRDYNFGSATVNRIRLTHGRDVILEPAQHGKPINIFVYPYVEIDGQPHKKIKWTATFKDLESQ